MSDFVSEGRVGRQRRRFRFDVRPVTVQGLPYHLHASVLPEGACPPAAGGPPDVAVLTWTGGRGLIAGRYGVGRAAVMPTVDAGSPTQSSGSASDCDIVLGAIAKEGLKQSIDALEAMIERMRRLPTAVVESADIGGRVLVWVHVRGPSWPNPDVRRMSGAARLEAAIPGGGAVADAFVREGILARSMARRGPREPADWSYAMTEAGARILDRMSAAGRSGRRAAFVNSRAG